MASIKDYAEVNCHSAAMRAINKSPFYRDKTVCLQSLALPFSPPDTTYYSCSTDNVRSLRNTLTMSQSGRRLICEFC